MRYSSGQVELVNRIGLLALAAALSAAAGADAAPSGVVVRDVGPGAAMDAGLVRGDILLFWYREERQGSFATPFDVLEVETVESPQGQVTIVGQRGESPIELTLPPGKWLLETTPILDETTLEVLSRAADAEEGVSDLLRLASGASEAGDRELGAWLLIECARRQEAWETAARLFSEALLSVTGDLRTEAWIYEIAGEEAHRIRQLDEALRLHEEGLRRRIELTGESLLTVRSLSLMARVAWGRRDLVAAEDLLERALDSLRCFAPESLETASALNNLGILRQRRGDLVGSEACQRESLTIKEKLLPDSMGVAASLGNLAVVYDLRGDLRTAEAYGRRALEIEQRLAPDSAAVAQRLNNLAVLARNRGDLLLAEELLLRSLVIKENLEPGGLSVAACLNNLGGVALSRNDIDGAEAFFKRSLAIKAKIAPESEEMATTLSHLGEIERHRQRLGAAEAYHRRALTVREEISPGSTSVAGSLADLGSIAHLRGDFARSEDLYRRSLALLEGMAPAGLDAAAAYSGLAEVLIDRDELAEAASLHREALEIRQRLAPESTAVATSQFHLGRLLRRMERREEALAHLEAAMTALEHQGERLGGTRETLATFRTQFADLYREAVDLLLELGMGPQAYHVLERSRARGLLAMMAARDLVVGAVPEELEERRRSIDAEHSRLLAELAVTGGEDDDGLQEHLLKRLDELRQQRNEIRSRIRAMSPRLAALHYPEALDLAGSRQALDEGMVVLAYSLRRDHSLLFVFGSDPDDFTVHRLPVGEADLRNEIEAFRTEILRGFGRTSQGRVRLLSRHLTDVLLAPAAIAIARSKRLLILPDGDLHRLPFSAMLDPGEPGRWLVQSRPFTVAASTTVFGELKSSRHPRIETHSVAFGDPVYPEHDPPRSAQDPAAVRRWGPFLEPLPGSRAEVLGIGRIWGENADLWLGAQATEDRVMALGGDVNVVHLAVHGFLDDRFPLESGLAMTISPHPTRGENGIVQAWEVIEQLHLDADLVTLSACETGLGQELAGEGVLGLTRAFQFAGARGVLASLWRVDDSSTAELMVRFYRHRGGGLAASDALMAAQIDLIEAPLRDADGRLIDARHPYFWAAFQLAGDWR